MAQDVPLYETTEFGDPIGWCRTFMNDGVVTFRTQYVDCEGPAEKELEEAYHEYYIRSGAKALASGSARLESISLVSADQALHPDWKIESVSPPGPTEWELNAAYNENAFRDAAAGR